MLEIQAIPKVSAVIFEEWVNWTEEAFLECLRRVMLRCQPPVMWDLTIPRVFVDEITEESSQRKNIDALAKALAFTGRQDSGIWRQSLDQQRAAISASRLSKA
jgi:hypothetical protein